MSAITRGHSCILCQRRKVRCDKQKPCGNCAKANAECTVIPQQPRGKRNLAKLHGKDLLERLKRYEELMTKNGIEFGSIAHGGEDYGEPETPNNEKPFPNQNARGQSSARTNEERDPKWFAYYHDYRATNEMLQGSSEEESDRPTVHHAFDAMFDETTGFPFIAGSSQASKEVAYPSSIQSIQLWQIYINNVNPLLKISHIPTLQPQVIEASADLDKIPKPLRVLMFGIYFTAVNSMADEEVQTTFGEKKSILMARYRKNTEQALLDAGFMKSNDIMMLQGYVLYLIGLRPYMDPRSLFCCIGIAVRIATRLGLHRDGAQFNMSPFETEQRRRLWWQIVALDKRTADITGSPTSALSSLGTDCRFPLNVNDIDLHPHAKEPPSPSTGITEMTFFLTRIEITIASAPDGIRPNPKVPDNFRTNGGSSTSASTRKRATQSQSDHLDRYYAYMESVYLEKCNANIPIQLFISMMTRVSLCKLHVLDFICRGTTSVDTEIRQRDTGFLAAIELLEADNAIRNTQSLRGFIWYSYMELPLPGYLFLANELRYYTTGILCQRAWEAIVQSPYNQGLSHNLRSPLHVGLGQAILKAWDARQNSELQLGRALQPPYLIVSLRESLASHIQKQGPIRADFEDSRDFERGMHPSSVESRQSDEAADMLLNAGTTYNFTESINYTLPSAELDYNQMVWTNLMQSGAIGGFWGDLDSLGQ